MLKRFNLFLLSIFALFVFIFLLTFSQNAYAWSFDHYSNHIEDMEEIIEENQRNERAWTLCCDSIDYYKEIKDSCQADNCSEFIFYQLLLYAQKQKVTKVCGAVPDDTLGYTLVYNKCLRRDIEEYINPYFPLENMFHRR